MATNKKYTHDLNVLWDEFTSSSDLSLEEKELRNNTPENIENINSEIERLTFMLQTLLPSSNPKTNLQFKIDQLKRFFVSLHNLESLEATIVELSSKDVSELTEAEKQTIQNWNLNIHLVLHAFSDWKECLSIPDNASYREIIEKVLNRIEECDKVLKSINEKKNEKLSNLAIFEQFLQDKGLSIKHAELLLLHHYDPNKYPLTIEDKGFKMRKSHPMRDAFIKKVLIPTALTGAGIGAVVGAIAGSGLIGGSLVLGFIPVSGTPGLTAIATSMVGAVAGVIATPIIIKAKNALTKAYYKLVYKTAKKNLKEYEKGASIDSLYISSLIEKIQNTKQKVLEMNQGNWLTRKLKFIPKHFMNAVNRNRIHHLEAYTKDLVDMYNIIDHNARADKNEKLKPIYELLQHVESFIRNDIEESKVYAMLTCKENKKHSHISTIENIDIFANLKIYIDSITESLPKDKKIKAKEAKISSKNLRRKHEVASSFLKGGRLIERMLAEYERSLNSEIIEDDHVYDEDIASDEIIHILDEDLVDIDEEASVDVSEDLPDNLDNSQDEIINDNNLDIVEEVIEEPAETVEELPAEDNEETEVDLDNSQDEHEDERNQGMIFEFVENNETEDSTNEDTVDESESIEFTFDDDSNDVVNPPASTGTLVRRTTQRLKYSSSAITHAGETVGVKLNVDANGEKEKIEIRYMASKKKIRIRTADGEKFVPVTDTIIPPMNQMNEILKDIAKDKHIDNADSLTII